MKKLRLLFVLMIISLLWVWPQPVEAFGEGCAVYRSSSFLVTSGVWTAVSFNAERRDDFGCHAGDTTSMVVPQGYAGWYVISGSVYWNTAGGTIRYISISVNGLTVVLNGDRLSSSCDFPHAVSTLYYLNAGDAVQLYVYQNSGSSVYILSNSAFSPELRMVRVGPAQETLCGYPVQCSGPMDANFIVKSLGNQEEGYHWDRSGFWAHGFQHENDGPDEIDVSGLSGILSDTQDAGWLQGFSITMTAPTDSQVLAWDALASEWQPREISATAGGFTMPEVITTVISGTVPVVITNTYFYTQTLSTGHDIAVIRSFTYGEAAVAISMLALLAFMSVRWVFEVVR